MTPTSLLPQEAAAVGSDYATLCERIIASSLQIRKRN
jgi:D-alanine-D-alanine ligase